MELGKRYYFSGGDAYFHDPQASVILAYQTKEFIIIQKNREIRISVYPHSITNKRVIEWIKSWANQEDKIVTPSGRTLSLNGQILRSKTEFIYFIFNVDSNAVKIRRAKNVTKRLKSLQTGTPVKLKLLKIVDIKAGKEAIEQEQLLHSKFEHLRLLGEWFIFNDELQAFIDRI